MASRAFRYSEPSGDCENGVLGMYSQRARSSHEPLSLERDVCRGGSTLGSRFSEGWELKRIRRSAEGLGLKIGARKERRSDSLVRSGTTFESVNVGKTYEEKIGEGAGEMLGAHFDKLRYRSLRGSPAANAANKWPRREARLKGIDSGQKPYSSVVDVISGRRKLFSAREKLFTDDVVSTVEKKNVRDYVAEKFAKMLSTRSTTLDYQTQNTYLKWNFTDSIAGVNSMNVLNGSKASEAYMHNKTVALVTGDSFLPKLFNDTLDYTACPNGTDWANATECEAGFVTTGVPYYSDDALHLLAMIATAFFLGLIILATIIGNVFVIAAILLERNLQNVANYLILSLAVADLLVACLVMPLGAVYEVSKQWTLGPELCDMWTSSDVLCCTASILHLVAIAIDRYWAVTNIDYIHQRTSRRIGVMILIIWGVAFAVCIAPMLGWKDAEWEERIYKNQTCLVSQDIGYQVFATLSSFYVPLFVILILYWRIFQTARKRIRRRANQGAAVTSRNPSAGGVIAGAAGGSGGIAAAVVAVIGRPLPTVSETTTAFTTVSSTNTSPEKQPLRNGVEADLPTADCVSSYQQAIPYPAPAKKKVKEAADSKRERKAAKTLAIITGAFVMCWLPFFILAILLPICKTCNFNPYVISFCLWLGYFNSTLNPIIYTIFSPEFRQAFKRILCGRRAGVRRQNVRHFGQRHF